ncbi:hypothetical protein OJAV_G00236180 [Oryzias javanicus]|uniref:MHC class I-like antigen recognition-like domain-containing protein n=1 Tax=Oryzias javanicus TaxID=123683 RepID=A0A437BYG8_ORYJA|nr:hypothetical protein OJAV_G00236180 [Oryzias javanicus]
MKTFLTLIFLCHGASAVKHSLKYFLTGISGTTNSPEFAGIATIDEVEVGHCDSIIGKAEPKEDWARKVVNNNPQVLEWYAKECLVHQHFFKANMEVFKQRLNQTEGSHILQRLSSCEWDDESGEIEGFDQYGYDGEDFIALDMQALTWITPKHKPLEQSVLQCLSSKRLPPLWSAVMPLIYPDRADLFWRKDGEEIHEGVEKGQILPNHDGTFQMSSELNVSLIKHEDWRSFSIRVSCFSGCGGAAGVFLLLVLSGFLYCCRRKGADFQPVRGDLGKEEES